MASSTRRKPTRDLWARFVVLAVLVAAACEPAPAPSAPSRAALAGRILLPWDAAVGRVLGDESASEGPMSFALEPGGGLLVLDQVNARVLELDGQGDVEGVIALPSRTFDDVEQYEGRAVVALDRLVGRVLRVMDRQGELLVEVPLEGRGIEQGGAVTAMLPRPDGVWLEVDHRYSVRVLDRALQPCERQVVLGRPIANGRSLRAALDGNGGVVLATAGRAVAAAEESATLRGGAPIERIVWLDADRRGRIHVALHEVLRAAEAPFGVESERTLLLVLDEHLREISRVESPFVHTELDQRVEVRVASDGRAWQMAFTPAGVLLVDWGGGQP